MRMERKEVWATAVYRVWLLNDGKLELQERYYLTTGTDGTSYRFEDKPTGWEEKGMLTPPLEWVLVRLGDREATLLLQRCGGLKPEQRQSPWS